MTVQQTSLKAFWNEVKPTLASRHEQVLEALKTRKNFTNKELSMFLGWDVNRVTPRVNELVKMGLVEKDEQRKCTFTRRTAIAWSAQDISKKINYI